MRGTEHLLSEGFRQHVGVQLVKDRIGKTLKRGTRSAAGRGSRGFPTVDSSEDCGNFERIQTAALLSENP